MRCISPFAGYSIQVYEAVERLVTDSAGRASTHTDQRPVIADFEHQGLLAHEEEIALSAFTFSGLPEGVHPLSRVGVFDTEVYALRFPVDQREKMKAKLERGLRDKQAQFSTQFIIVEEPEAPIPWGSYDGDNVKEVIEFQQRLQIDPSLVRRYEAENKNRPTIVEAMLELEASAPVEEEIVVGA